MSTCKQINTPELNLEEDVCNGEIKNTDCVIQSAAIAVLGLPVNSTQTEINAAMVTALTSLVARVQYLEDNL